MLEEKIEKEKPKKILKQRVDEFLVEKKYFLNLKETRANIMAGKVFINEEKITTAGKIIKISGNENVRIKEKKKFVSRAGVKLEKAIKYWNINLNDKIMLDVGASTGGFVDCALQNKIKEVYALDVGTNQLDYTIRKNPKVKVYEQTNFRTIKENQFPNKFDVITMDVSFISITLLFEQVKNNLKQNGIYICLIKPQFEADKNIERINGIIVDDKVHKDVIESVKISVEKNELKVIDLIESPILGTKGNKEFLVLIKHKDTIKDTIDNSTASNKDKSIS